MNLAFITGLPDWGGSEYLWMETAHAAMKAGHRVGLWVYQNVAGHRQIERLKHAGAEIFYRRPLPFGRFGRYVAPLTRPFRELESFGADAMLVSQPSSYTIVESPDFGRLGDIIRRARIPYVVVCQWNSDSVCLSDRSRAIGTDYFRRAYRVAFVAEANMVTARRQCADPLANAIVVRNPVNVADISAVPWPDDNVVRMASVARLSVSYKGQDLLLEVLSTPEWLRRDWRLTFYGKGEDERYLQDLIQRFGLRDHVSFAGHVDDLRKVWSENHLLVMPSRSEGTPLSMVEAMLCGRPAMVTDVGGNVEWIDHGKTGFVAPAVSVRSIADAMEEAWTARSGWQTMGLTAREKALSQVDLRPGESMLQLLVEAAQNRTAEGRAS